MSNQKYAVTEWHDTEDILNRLDNLVKSPLRTIERDKMEDYLAYFIQSAINPKP